ncbi:MAG: 16S rRNA (guanine(966)-N(2))-methyltransferase RsmD [Geobacteraceae bacterium GWC2_53_11]|nr:MAG: 16S rRNA (guanine(966)-N(2))-methyltransferase RsmD [Geobacteraceae bacterium GWC2_53_11]
MRVIAGAFRGKKLSAPLDMVTRPTSDRVKEALFSILASRIDFTGIRVLDICAGTGALGIEALSRGAGFCCFVESDRTVAALLEKNIMAVNSKNNAEIVTMDAVKGVKSIAGRGVNFDLVFFDPPYDSDLYARIPESLDAGELLSSGAILVAECSARKPLPELFGRLKRIDRRVYGETALELFAREE